MYGNINIMLSNNICKDIRITREAAGDLGNYVLFVKIIHILKKKN
jgi:hypothetical protein